jgi:hypothetical protein
MTRTVPTKTAARDYSTASLLLGRTTACSRPQLGSESDPTRDCEGADAQLLMTLCLTHRFCGIVQ